MTNSSHITYTSVQQQISKLQPQNLIVNDIPFALDCLKLCGYSNLINCFKPAEQTKLVQSIYDSFLSNRISLESQRKLLMDTLFICLEYRNLAAHGGRVYNYVSSSKVRYSEIFSSSNMTIKYSGFSELISLLSFFSYKTPEEKLRKTLNTEINRHCRSYPQDATYLGQILNVNIVPQYFVYISPNSKKFHSVPHCSGIHSSFPIELNDAIQQGYIACKRCNRNM